MNNNIIKYVVIATFAMIYFSSCEKEGDNESKVSSYNSSESHHAGQNCMDCHKSGGPGEGLFVVAGTVYDKLKENPYPNATIKLYTGVNATGNLVTSIEVDKNGNFYTTKAVNFGNGLYMTVEGSKSTQSMSSSTTIGSCNSCHGKTIDKIWIE